MYADAQHAAPYEYRAKDAERARLPMSDISPLGITGQAHDTHFVKNKSLLQSPTNDSGLFSKARDYRLITIRKVSRYHKQKCLTHDSGVIGYFRRSRASLLGHHRSEYRYYVNIITAGRYVMSALLTPILFTAVAKMRISIAITTTTSLAAHGHQCRVMPSFADTSRYASIVDARAANHCFQRIACGQYQRNAARRAVGVCATLIRFLASSVTRFDLTADDTDFTALKFLASGLAFFVISHR